MNGVPLTDIEWRETQVFFPLLKAQDRGLCLKIADPTPAYNCIAWSLGITNLWIDPPQPRSAFEAFYEEMGYGVSPLGGAEIDGYVHWRGDMAHASRRDGNVWSSKRGPDMGMTHPRYKLQGQVYGFVEVSFTRNPSTTTITTTTTSGAEATYSASSSDSKLEAATVAAIRVTDLVERSAKSFPTLADDFDKNWQAWQDTWTNSDAKEVQSSDYFAQGPAWDALVSMGTAILPQVVGKLQSDSNIFGCQLYNKLQTDPTKKVDPGNLTQYWVLNNQAKAIVSLYGAQMASFESFATDWAAAQGVKARSSDSYTSGSAYNAIREMGKLAVPLIMDMYASQRYGWWHELLYEIEHGKKSGAEVFDKVALYKQWSNWFQNVSAPQRSRL